MKLVEGICGVHANAQNYGQELNKRGKKVIIRPAAKAVQACRFSSAEVQTQRVTY